MDEGDKVAYLASIEDNEEREYNRRMMYGEPPLLPDPP